MDIQVSIIIVNYNSAAFARKCLHSIFATTASLIIEVIVIDNASFDGCADMISREFPQVIFVQSASNVGFAAANNLGVLMARGKKVLFLNPDTEIQGPAIQELFAALESSASAGIVGARLLNSDGSVQTTSITAFPSILNQVLGAEYLRKMLPHLRLWGIEPLYVNHHLPVPVDAVSGACMMIRREVVQQVKGFTASFFMYAEDLDLCLKVKNAGWNVYYVPSALIIHHGAQSSKSREEKHYADLMIKQSMYQFMDLHRGWWYSRLFKVAMGIVALGRLSLLAIVFGFSGMSTRGQSLSQAWAKWIGILGWSFGTQRWVSRERLRAQY